MVLLIVSMSIALGISALCSLLEAALLSFTPSQVAELHQKRPHLGSLWRDFKRQIDRPIAVILILNTAAHTIGATIAGAQFEVVFGPQGIVIFSLIFTYLMLQFTEILPKTLGVYYNRQIAVVIAYPLAILVKILFPLVFLVRLINKPFERSQEGKETAVTQSEITALAGLARVSKMIGEHQERIITGAWRLSKLSVREVMIPVDQVTFLSTDQSLMDAILAAHMDPHTRFPIIEKSNQNQVLGYVNFKEMIYRARTNPHDQSLRGIIRPVHFVKPGEPAAMLLRAFVDLHEHVAIVRDEDGKSLGLITLEDIVEELVGDLEDEFDRLPRQFHPLTEETWMVGGGMTIKELAKRLNITIQDPHGTASAWLIRRFGRLPKVNEIHRENGYSFQVRRTRRNNIFEISVTRDRPPGNSQDARNRSTESNEPEAP